jgi:hypothetical protein
MVLISWHGVAKRLTMRIHITLNTLRNACFEMIHPMECRNEKTLAVKIRSGAVEYIYYLLTAVTGRWATVIHPTYWTCAGGLTRAVWNTQSLGQAYKALEYHAMVNWMDIRTLTRYAQHIRTTATESDRDISDRTKKYKMGEEMDGGWLKVFVGFIYHPHEDSKSARWYGEWSTITRSTDALLLKRVAEAKYLPLPCMAILHPGTNLNYFLQGNWIFHETTR